ncbi:MAG TPA: prolyl oligopeptidase family serine peptidase [Candidatus Binatia bacterium]|nr:prolyl oligopeptidase family serine peptidase [Candidatus Binatia bacterium]
MVQSRSAGTRRRAPSRVVPSLLLALQLAACNPLLEPRDPASGPVAKAYPGTETIEASLQNGWITLTLSLPQRPAGPKPVVITPIADERLLLERGIAVVRFRTHWEQLRAFSAARAAPAADSKGEPGKGDPASEAAPGKDAASPADIAAATSAPAPGPPQLPTVPAPDATTVGAWLLAAPRPGIVGQAYFDLISVDANDTIPKVVDYLRTLPQIDPDRISISGSSTSGFVALQALANDPRLAVGVVRVACGDYFLFLRDSSLALGGDPRWLPNGRVELDPPYEARLRAAEPIRRADRFPPRPVLLMAGEQDRAIPIDCARRTADALKAAYARARLPDRFRFVVFPGEGHNLGEESQQEAIAWWQRWLVHDARQAPSASGLSHEGNAPLAPFGKAERGVVQRGKRFPRPVRQSRTGAHSLRVASLGSYGALLDRGLPGGIVRRCSERRVTRSGPAGGPRPSGTARARRASRP